MFDQYLQYFRYCTYSYSRTVLTYISEAEANLTVEAVEHYLFYIDSLDHDWEESEVSCMPLRKLADFCCRIFTDSLQILSRIFRISWRDYYDLLHIIPNFLNKFKRAILTDVLARACH